MKDLPKLIPALQPCRTCDHFIFLTGDDGHCCEVGDEVLGWWMGCKKWSDDLEIEK
ncbi:MAG: hypothetical protein PHP93_08030 [Kiritimatiellales bacterium]|nr:hypothetical protein [Kiritimatiellales bacterium]